MPDDTLTFRLTHCCTIRSVSVPRDIEFDTFVSLVKDRFDLDQNPSAFLYNDGHPGVVTMSKEEEFDAVKSLAAADSASADPAPPAPGPSPGPPKPFEMFVIIPRRRPAHEERDPERGAEHEALLASVRRAIADSPAFLRDLQDALRNHHNANDDGDSVYSFLHHPPPPMMHPDRGVGCGRPGHHGRGAFFGWRGRSRGGPDGGRGGWSMGRGGARFGRPGPPPPPYFFEDLSSETDEDEAFFRPRCPRHFPPPPPPPPGRVPPHPPHEYHHGPPPPPPGPVHSWSVYRTIHDYLMPPPPPGPRGGPPGHHPGPFRPHDGPLPPYDGPPPPFPHPTRNRYRGHGHRDYRGAHHRRRDHSDDDLPPPLPPHRRRGPSPPPPPPAPHHRHPHHGQPPFPGHFPPPPPPPRSPPGRDRPFDRRPRDAVSLEGGSDDEDDEWDEAFRGRY
ncbi:hypothetical protein JCM10212_000749 [Sporobolomyces blumeae]